jgi:hypothetical protein
MRGSRGVKILLLQDNRPGMILGGRQPMPLVEPCRSIRSVQLIQE